MYTRRSPYLPSILGEHAGHEIVVDIDRYELPAVAITTCKTCHKELQREQLPIRVIAYGRMCFGSNDSDRFLELMPTAFFVQPDHAPHGDQYTRELRDFIGKEARSLLAQLEMGTVECTFDFHNGTVISEPALLIEPVAISEDASGHERHTAEQFETLWQAHSNPNQVDEALTAMPLVRQLLERYHDSYYDLAINQDPERAAEAHTNFIRAVEALYTFFNPIDQETEPTTPPAADPNEWWEDNPPKTEAASC